MIHSIVRPFCFFLLILPSAVVAQDGQHPAPGLRLFNTDILGKSPGSPIVTLESKRTGLIDPVSIQLDVVDGRFHAATICYPDKIDVNVARDSINRTFREWAMPGNEKNAIGGVWRNERKRFAISLARIEEDGIIRVCYIRFIGDKVVSKEEAEQPDAPKDRASCIDNGESTAGPR